MSKYLDCMFNVSNHIYAANNLSFLSEEEVQRAVTDRDSSGSTEEEKWAGA